MDYRDRALNRYTRRAPAALALLGLAGALALGSADAMAESGASAVMYHRFGEGDYPSTNTTIEQFEMHLNELRTGGYNVVALDEIVSAISEGRELGSKTVAITIDDAYLSVHSEAFPRLVREGFPFTLFVATDAVDRAESGEYKRYMNWEQVREIMQHPLGTIGSQTASHLHMIDSSEDAIRRDIERANARFEEKLGARPDIIAYPYGEFSNRVIAIVKDMGFKAGFGQHSGAFGPGDDVFALPRFALNENYGDLERFRTGAGALPIRVEDALPLDTVIEQDENPPAMGFTVVGAPGGGINCFSSHEGKIATERLGPNRIEVRMTEPVPAGRTRVNCTAPAGDGRWYWLGRLFYLKK